MSRREFSKAVKVAAFNRCQKDGFRCEMPFCRAPLTTGRFHYDHVIPDALGGEPTLENCAVVCVVCHAEKTTKEDVPRIAKAKRQEAKHIGAVKPKGRIPKPLKALRSTTKTDRLREMRERQYEERQR